MMSMCSFYLPQHLLYSLLETAIKLHNFTAVSLFNITQLINQHFTNTNINDIINQVACFVALSDGT